MCALVFVDKKNFLLASYQKSVGVVYKQIWTDLPQVLMHNFGGKGDVNYECLQKCKILNSVWTILDVCATYHSIIILTYKELPFRVYHYSRTWNSLRLIKPGPPGLTALHPLRKMLWNTSVDGVELSELQGIEEGKRKKP